MNYAPVVLFVYNRPYHTNIVLNSLSECLYADKTDLFVFSDAAKNDINVMAVTEVRNLISDKKWKKVFKTYTVIEAEENKGLAKSVITGVTRIINQYGRVIVVEDDNRVSNDFIDYMDRALDYYYNNKKVGSIGAYTLPITIPTAYKYDVFLMGRGSSYAWATWKEFWNLIDWDVKDYKSFKYNIIKRWEFNKFGQDRARMLDRQMRGEIDSWAIRYTYALFKNNLFTILPRQTRVENIGDDGSGTNLGINDDMYRTKIDENLKPVVFADVEIDPEIRKNFVSVFARPPIINRITTKLRKMVNHKSRRLI